jgi:hypothetical protein
MSDSFDASEFIKGLNLADVRVRKGDRRGVAKLLMHGERRAKELVPVLTGTLAGTIVGDVRGIQVSDQAVEGFLTAGGGEASDYAVIQHEVALNHTHPVAGCYASKYIERPLVELSRVAAGILAVEIQKELA